MTPTLLPSKDEARLCASVVRDLARDLSLADDPVAIGKLTVLVARLFNSGLRTREELMSAAMKSAGMPSNPIIAPTDH
ncbi:hypothetical protein FZ934_12480 [Rhizobium grahamii]|uniref:Uncharacterized protein n=1 Tax=Rhizobium grahamii TaxID=1120045 RepID=A0A5Q0CAU5_9HYPH|nr:hypothetical protein FZ934_12480 [Rhizobium grahamii]QRM49697.1 hypothetical protein F3Y33_10410 [Rhizobium sp. BG6]